MNVNIRVYSDDKDRISFLQEYLTQEGISFGPCSQSEAIRWAIRKIVDALCRKYERMQLQAGNVAAAKPTVTDVKEAESERSNRTGQKAG